jgi:hypothetical protein
MGDMTGQIADVVNDTPPTPGADTGPQDVGATEGLNPAEPLPPDVIDED